MLYKLISAFIISLCLCLISTDKVQATSLPSGFTESQLVNGLDTPTSMAFAPDGRLFVTEKNGKLRIIKNGQLVSNPFLTLAVDTYIERGLLGVAFDPNFETNRFIYVYYTTPSPNPKNRVSRFMASTNPDSVEPNTERVLLDNIPSDAGMHNAGALHFGLDGKLYIAVGDGGQTSTNAQSLSSLSGKILRINNDGTIPSDNPFNDTPDARDEVWNYGLRNPFTFAIHPSIGTMMINDVGANIWEEVNLGSKGANYGWPTCEGECDTAGFTNPVYQMYHPMMTSITGASFYTGDTFPSTYKSRYFFGDYVKNFIKQMDYANGYAVTDFAIDAPSPVDIDEGADGNLYYLSIGNGAVYKITFNSGVTPSPTPTIMPTPTTIPENGNGLLATYYNNNDLSGQSTKRIDNTIDFNWGTAAPVAPIDADTFSVRWQGQVTPQYSEEYTFYTLADDGVRLWVNDQLLIDNWTDQSATEKQAKITLVAGQKYNIKIEYYDNNWDAIAKLTWSSPSQSKQIIPQNRLSFSTNQNPEGQIMSPHQGKEFNAGETIAYSGNATDNEDGTLPASAYEWRVVFHHDTHTHPFFGPVNGVKSGSFQIPQTGESASNIWYRVHLKVTDSDGATHTTFNDIYPKKANIAIDSYPSGMKVDLDGQPMTTKYTFTGVVGFKRTLNAPLTQTFNGKTYAFVSWSDGGAANHIIETPNKNTQYTATYREVMESGNGLLGTYFDRTDFSGTTLQRIDPNINFDWGTNAPINGLEPSYYSVRWTGEIQIPQDGTYTFYTTTDDGARLWIEDNEIIDKWQPQSATEHAGTINLQGNRKYKIRMEFYNSPWDGIAKLSWSGPSITKQIIPQSALFANTQTSGDGLNGQYFDNKDFTGPSITKVDPVVEFDWETGKPISTIDPETFSVKWTGYIKPQTTDTYTFYTTTDDGVSLTINDKRLIDNLQDQSATEKAESIMLYSGVKYPITMEYYENGWDAVAKLKWSNSSITKESIPQANLFSW